jgi:hypothetical protein
MSPASLEKLYFLLPRSEIGFLRFILESYDGLGFARTLDPRQGLVEIAFPASRRLDVERLLGALAGEIGIKEVPAPVLVPSL